MAERNISAYTRPRYIESAFSQTVYVGVLKTPTLSLNGTSATTTGLLSWGNIDDNTSYYELWVSYNGGAWELYDDNIFYPAASYQLNGALADGTYKFKIRATAVITDPDTYVTASYYSAFSNETFEFTVVTLDTPVLQDITGTSQYYWAAITNADYYRFAITKDNATTSVITILAADRPTAADPYILDYNEAGVYTLVATAYNNNPFLYHNSLESESKTYTVIKLNTPVLDDDEFTADPPVIYWSTIQYASGYDIYLNNVLVMENHSSLNYNYTNDIADFPGVYDFSGKIKAVVANQVQYSNPKYLPSEFSNEITWGVLPDPVIAFSTETGRDNVILITNYSLLQNTQLLEIYDGNTLMDTVPLTESYELTTEVERIFNIRMKAISNDPHMTDSGLSNLLTYQVVRLRTPMLVDNSQADSTVLSISWNAIVNADFYDVYINGVVSASTSGVTYNVELPVGNSSIYIIARSNAYRYLDSYRSNIITRVQDPLSQYLVKINDLSYEVSVPFVFTETLDETMDTAVISTVPLGTKTPFEAYEEVDIIASSLAGDENITEYKQLPGFPKHMILAQDDVEEIVIGDTSKYIHHLNLIERTKLLETELMPDFSITQPMEYAQAVNELKGDFIIPDYGGNYIWKNSDPNRLAQYTQRTFLTYCGSTYHFIDGLNDQSIRGELFSIVHKGDSVYLPYETSTSFDIFYSYVYFMELLTTLGLVSTPSSSATYNSLTDYGIKLKKTYKYRNHNDSYDPVEGFNEHVIATYTDGIQHEWDTSSIDVGIYDLILEVTIDENDLKVLRNKMYDSDWRALHDGTDQLLDVVPQFMYPTTVIDAAGAYVPYGLGCAAAPIPRPSLPDWWNETKVYRVVWKNVTITNIGSYNADDIIPFESKSIKEAIDKALLVCKPIGVNRNTTPKYTLDPKFDYLGNYTERVLDSKLRKVNYHPCPELKFQNQKSLYEVLLEIGRLFYGIPRLGCYDENDIWQPNMITFDVLDQATINAANASTFVDQNTMESSTSTIDNHNTGFISKLSNVVNNEYYEVYPAGDLWITPRSGSESDPLANKDNMSIVLDRPIYRIVDIIVKNFDPNQPDRSVSIKQFVTESTIFQSLTNNMEGKGTSIYYSQGDNKIEGLGNIPRALEAQAAMGLDPTWYVISLIVSVCSGNVSVLTINDRVDSLQYKVLYIPYVDNTIYTEQSNIAGLKNQNYKTLNQENNIITDSSFGKSAQTQVERLGNNTITKSFVNVDVNALPKLGQIKEFDGYKYYADVITYKFNNSSIEAETSFSRNFNKINERVGIDAMYRLFRIYADDYVDRSININRYCYLSKSSYSTSAGTMQNTSYRLVSEIKNSFNNGSNKSVPNIKPDSLYVRNMNEDSTRLQYNMYATGALTNVPAIVIPVNYNTYNNSISLSAEMKDNYAAGVSTVKWDSTSNKWVVDSYNKQKIQHDARYVDTNGENPVMGFTLFRYTDDTKLGITGDTYPIANYLTSGISNLNESIYSEKIKVDKDNKERIKFNYQLHFLTYDKNLTIHSGILSRLFKNDDRFGASGEGTVDSPRYVLFKGDISKQDKLLNTKVLIGSFASFSNSRNRITIAQQTITSDSDYDGYALVWNDGSIIYSYKQSISSGSFTIPRMYMNFSDNKVSYKNS